jgi:hypothetical protein
MATRDQLDRVAGVKLELEGVGLGDARLDRRVVEIAQALAKRPGDSLPDAFVSSAALEATYRFLGNERVSPAAILKPHIALTQQRCRQNDHVLAVFDTTELRFGGERAGLGNLTHGRGLFAHVGLAVSADGRREPLGTLHLETMVRQGEPKQRRRASKATDNERLRWNRGVEAVHQALPRAICVMDREADVFDLARDMVEREQRFIIRASHNRNTDEGLLWELLDDMELVSTRTLDVAERRDGKRNLVARTRHPARSAHEATLEIRARRVQILTPDSTRNETTKRRANSLALHIVHVIEKQPPDGEPPVSWVLLTNLPIDTETQVHFVVDSYRARWVIEEFFKSLKTGCAFEKRQLESVLSVTNALAVSLPIAWLLLRLRNLSRDEPDRPAHGLLSPLMLHCLRVMHLKSQRRPVPDDPTHKELVWAIAALGGHIKNNGEPGFAVLGRGLERLIAATELAHDLGVQPNL